MGIKIERIRYHENVPISRRGILATVCSDVCVNNQDIYVGSSACYNCPCRLFRVGSYVVCRVRQLGTHGEWVKKREVDDAEN